MISREEKKVQNEILITLGRHKDFRLWRHTVGVGYGMYIVRNAMSLMRGRRVKAALDLLSSSQPIKFGIAGQSDISGLHKSGRAIWIEVKAPGKLKEESTEQKSWGAMIKRYGGFYCCTDNCEQLINRLKLEGLYD